MWTWLDDEARRVDAGVRFAESGDHAVSPPFCGAKIDKENLVLGVVDDVAEFAAELDEIGWSELALEDGVLEVIAPAAHNLEDAPQAFVVGDVVANKVRRAHQSARAGRKLTLKFAP